jgi:predicted Zn-dependent peptidase
MRSTRLFRRGLLPLALAFSLPVGGAEAPRIDVSEITLDNGMRFLLFERHESPTVMAGWVAHVGSANERPGITGISHLFEHMMFKGTRTIGTRDIQKDIALLERQEEIQQAMRAELSSMRERQRRGEIADLSSPESQTERYRELRSQFEELVARQREIIVKDELDQVYTRNGAEALNAGTTEDLTVYFVRVPSNRLELWAWLESDRLLNPVFREFYSERDVVREERRQRTESTPLGKFDEAFNALFWEAHPYGWPVVGWPSDVESITKPQADAYFATYYAPNNLTGVLAGDFQVEPAKQLIERYFGRIPRGGAEPPAVVTLEPEPLGEKRYNAEAETSPTVRIWYRAVPFVHKDRTVFDLLSDILSGRTGRLYKGLVLGRQVANTAFAVVDPRKYDGIFQIEAVVKDGQDPAAVEAAIYEELSRLADEEVPERELQKVKNQAKANAYRRLSSPFFIGIQLLMYDGLGDWRYINSYADEVDAVTAADLQRVARQCFAKEKRTVGTFVRKKGAAPEDPRLASLPAEAQAMVRQGLTQIQSEADPARLRQMIGQMSAMVDQAPAEMKPALEILRAEAEERLSTLESEKE